MLNNINKEKDRMMFKKSKKDENKSNEPKLSKSELKQKDIEIYFKSLSAKSKKLNINRIKKNFFKTDINFPCINKISNRYMFVLRDSGKVLRHDLGPELDLVTRFKVL